MVWRRFLGLDFDTLCGMDKLFLLNPYCMQLRSFVYSLDLPRVRFGRFYLYLPVGPRTPLFIGAE